MIFDESCSYNKALTMGSVEITSNRMRLMTKLESDNIGIIEKGDDDDDNDEGEVSIRVISGIEQ